VDSSGSGKIYYPIDTSSKKYSLNLQMAESNTAQHYILNIISHTTTYEKKEKPSK
jgi:hypothetical protein